MFAAVEGERQVGRRRPGGYRRADVPRRSQRDGLSGLR